MLKKDRNLMIILATFLIAGGSTFYYYTNTSKGALKESDSIKLEKDRYVGDELRQYKILKLRNTFEHKGKKFEEGIDVSFYLLTIPGFPYASKPIQASIGVRILDNYVLDLDTNERLDKANYMVGGSEDIIIEHELEGDIDTKFVGIQSRQRPIKEIQLENYNDVDGFYKNLKNMELIDFGIYDGRKFKVIYDKKNKFVEFDENETIGGKGEIVDNEVYVYRNTVEKRSGALKITVKLPIYNSRTKTYEVQNVELASQYKYNANDR